MSWEAVSAIIAVTALVVTAIHQVRQADATRLANLNTVRARIQDIRFKEGEILAIPDVIARAKKFVVWNHALFNELEWLSFLYLKGEIPGDLMIEHMGPELLEHNERFHFTYPARTTSNLEALEAFRRVVGIVRAKNPGRSQPPFQLDMPIFLAPIAPSTRLYDSAALSSGRIDITA